MKRTPKVRVFTAMWVEAGKDCERTFSDANDAWSFLFKSLDRYQMDVVDECGNGVDRNGRG